MKGQRQQIIQVVQFKNPAKEVINRKFFRMNWLKFMEFNTFNRLFNLEQTRNG